MPAYDPLNIALYFGSYPQINISESNIGLSSGTRMVPQIVLNDINSFHVVISFPIVQLDTGGTYQITISEGETTVAMRQITIVVSRK